MPLVLDVPTIDMSECSGQYSAVDGDDWRAGQRQHEPCGVACRQSLISNRRL